MSTGNTTFHIDDTVEKVVAEVAGFVASLAKERSQRSGRFTVALAGGTTPRALYELLATAGYAANIPWQRWYVFWGDERCVPPDHKESNYRMAQESLLSRVAVPEGQVHRMKGEMNPEEAAREYESVLRGTFPGESTPALDLVLLGMGEDGHTASLFPGTAALEAHDRLVVANWVPQLGAYRLTITLSLINEARVVAFLATGSAKADALRRAVKPSTGEAVPPAGLVRPRTGDLLWFASADTGEGVTG